MLNIALRSVSVVMMLFCGTLIHAQGVVVIGHAGVKKLDASTVLRIYTGRAIEVDGTSVTAVNAPVGSAIRGRFLQNCLKQDEDKYTAHWTVRKYVGKGASPKEISRSGEVLTYVSSTPGAIGYLDESEIGLGANVLLRCGAPSSQSPIMYLFDLLASQWEKLAR